MKILLTEFAKTVPMKCLFIFSLITVEEDILENSSIIEHNAHDDDRFKRLVEMNVFYR